MPIQTAQFRIRHLRRHEIEQLLQLCKAEGRHMGTVTEVETWMQIDPQGFFVAVNPEGNYHWCNMRLIGCLPSLPSSQALNGRDGRSAWPVR